MLEARSPTLAVSILEPIVISADNAGVPAKT